MFVWVGLCPKQTSLNNNAFSEKNSFGVYLVDGLVGVHGKNVKKISQCNNGDILDVCIDTASGKLWFKINGKFMGISCQSDILELKEVDLFPTVLIKNKDNSIQFLNPDPKDMLIPEYTQAIEKMDFAEAQIKSLMADKIQLQVKLRLVETQLHSQT